MDTTHLAWSAPEYEHREHDADWYWVVGIITVALAIAFFIIDNTLLSVILILGVGTLLLLSRHEPRVVQYEISRLGIRTGKTLYRWDSLESFWIVEGDKTVTPEISPKILLTSKKSFMPHIVIPLGTTEPEEVHSLLMDKLPEEYQMEPLADRVMRKLGF